MAIVYATELRWRGVHLHLSSVLAGAEGNVRTQTSISKCRILQTGDRITAEAPKQGVKGVWDADSRPCERVIYETEAGGIQWRCFQPRSRTEVRIKNCTSKGDRTSKANRTIHGLGYAECLTVTVLPWSLPLKELRWGRFVSPRDSLVWVDWKGAYDTSFAMVNGEERELLSATGEEVATPEAKLRIGCGFTLREGRLRSTILPDVPALDKLLPGSLFRVEETKWCSRGEMFSGNHSSSGWVIHEVVHW